MRQSCLLNGPPIVEVFDERRLVRYRQFVRTYAQNLERACAEVSAQMWVNWLRGPRSRRRRSQGA
jgi:hypothetical protein